MRAREWVRPGLMLYGISPCRVSMPRQLGLRPAMTLSTQLIAVRDVPRGESVGYGGIWRAPARLEDRHRGHRLRRRLSAQHAQRYAGARERQRSAASSVVCRWT